MSAIKNRVLISEDNYLAEELNSPIKHEYVAGIVYAMAWARNLHNIIVGNIFARLDVRLEGKRCQPFNSDTKIRVKLPAHVRYYYPDASVTCDPNPVTDTFQQRPKVIAEVLSRRTRRIDEGEKKEAYLRIPSLAVYLLAEQDGPIVVVFRRKKRTFVREVFEGLEAVIPLPEIDIALPLAEIYRRVEFVPEAEDC